MRLLATGATWLAAAHVDVARPHVVASVTDYYEDRYLADLREFEVRGRRRPRGARGVGDRCTRP